MTDPQRSTDTASDRSTEPTQQSPAHNNQSTATPTMRARLSSWWYLAKSKNRCKYIYKTLNKEEKENRKRLAQPIDTCRPFTSILTKFLHNALKHHQVVSLSYFQIMTAIDRLFRPRASIWQQSCSSAVDAHAELYQGPRQPAILGNHQDNFGELKVRPEQGRRRTDRGGVGAGDGSGVRILGEPWRIKRIEVLSFLQSSSGRWCFSFACCKRG